MISAVVLTKNEEKNISDCLRGISWCDEVIIVDDYSEDETLEKAAEIQTCLPARQGRKGAKIKFFQRRLDDDWAGQRNFGLEKASNQWVLFVDADERITEQLKSEIELRVTSYDLRVNGFFLKRKDFLFGKWLEHGETSRVRLLRLAKKNAGKWERRVDEVWKVKGKIGELKNPLLHYPHQTLTEFLESINFFSTLNARAFYEQGARVRLWDWLKPLAKFTQNYFFRLGFLDGTAGFVHAVLMSLHSFAVRTKLYLIWKREGGWRETFHHHSGL